MIYSSDLINYSVRTYGDKACKIVSDLHNDNFDTTDNSLYRVNDMPVASQCKIIPTPRCVAM